MAEYQRALAAGDVDAIVAAFEPDGYAREPAGGQYVHRGPDGLRAFYERLFSNGGGIPLEHCALIDDGRACALEYNVVRWGKTELPPQAGVAVYVRGSERQARRGPHLRRRRPAARPTRRSASYQGAAGFAAARRSQPWKGEWSPASQASRSPGALRSQSGRISRVTSRRSLPEVGDRRATPEPVAVVDAVDDEPRLEHERVRDHRVVLGVGVLLDVEVPLDDAPGVGEERPLGADRRAELLERRGGRRSRSWRSGCRPRRSSDRTRRARGAAGAPSGSSGRARA